MKNREWMEDLSDGDLAEMLHSTCKICAGRTSYWTCTGDCRAGIEKWLGSEHLEEDGWDRIGTEAALGYRKYWGCQDSGCDTCPSTVDGRKPYERYRCDGDCQTAQKLDIVQRCRRTAARGGLGGTSAGA